MNLSKKLIILLIILLIPSLAFSAYVSKGSLYKFMEISGLNEQLGDLPGMFEAGLDQANQQQQGLPEELYTEIRKAAIEAFDPTRFRVYISNQIRTGITEGDAIDLIAWFESPVGREIVAAEIDASKPENLPNMMASAETVMADAALMENAKIIADLTGAVDMAMELQTKTAIAVFAAVTTALNPEEKVDTTAFAQQLKAQETQMRASAESMILLSMAYTYRNIDPAKIDRYIDFLRTPAAQKVNECVNKGLTAAFIKSINNMAKALKASLRN